MQSAMLGPSLLSGFTVCGVWLDGTHTADGFTATVGQVDAFRTSSRIDGKSLVRRNIDGAIRAVSEANAAQYTTIRYVTRH